MPAGDEDEFGVSLRWPDDNGPGDASTAAAGAVVDDEGFTRPEGETIENETLRPVAKDSRGAGVAASGAPGVGRALLPAISNRLHDLQDSVVRLNDTVSPLIEAQASSLEELRRHQDRSLSELRRSVKEGDAGLRQLAGQIDGLADDIAALNDLVRAVVERGPGAPLEVDGLHDALLEMQAASASLIETAEVLAGPNPAQGAALDDLASELAALRDEVTQLKRRVGVRAKTSTTLDEEQVAALIDRLVDRLGPRATAEPAVVTLGDADVERIVAGVLEQIERTFEIVSDPDPDPAPAKATKPTGTLGGRPSKSAPSTARTSRHKD